MDCRGFRKQHFAYLDDTMCGDDMADAQRHIMSCDSCAAHDTMVRRSLMLVRNMSVIEPSVEFRQRMQARLGEARDESRRQQFLRDDVASVPKARFSFKPPFVVTAIAATVFVAGVAVWRDNGVLLAPSASLQASTAAVTPGTAVDTTQNEIYLAPGIVQAMATGNPMWPAALIVDDASSRFENVGFSEVKSTR